MYVEKMVVERNLEVERKVKSLRIVNTEVISHDTTLLTIPKIRETMIVEPSILTLETILLVRHIPTPRLTNRMLQDCQWDSQVR